MKVTVVGAGGNVGSTVVDALAQRDICKEIVAVDIEKKDGDKTFYPSKGRGLDQWESAPSIFLTLALTEPLIMPIPQDLMFA